MYIGGPRSGALLIETPLKPLLHSSVSSGYPPIPSLEALTEILKRFPSWQYANSVNCFNVYRVHFEELETEGRPPVAISHVIEIAIADGAWQLWIWGRMVARDAIPALQQLPDALDADAIQNLLPMLETTPVCQGVWADNLLQLAQPRNPLSHLLDNTFHLGVGYQGLIIWTTSITTPYYL